MVLILFKLITFYHNAKSSPVSTRPRRSRAFPWYQCRKIATYLLTKGDRLYYYSL